jgi:hypothetical protein
MNVLRFREILGAAVLAVLAVACADPAPGPPLERLAEIAPPRASPAIVKGRNSDPSQDNVVLVMHYDALAKGGGAASGCSGSLLTPRLVLTARHCVSITDDGAACDKDGNAIAGGVVTEDRQPSAIYVFGGTSRPDFIGGTAKPSRGQEILTTGSKTLCNADIALVLLDRPVEGAKIAPVRLGDGPSANELVTVVGWGIADDDPNPPVRRQRVDVRVVEVGPGSDLSPKEFRIDEGTCKGDSGGPAIAASGAVLGALSRGGNGSANTGADACLGATNIFSSVSGHADFLRAGYAKAGQEPWLEGGPNPLLAPLGLGCAANADCQSDLCDLAAKSCTQDCSASACPPGYTCTSPSGAARCTATRIEESCATGPIPPGGPHSPTPSLAVGALFVSAVVAVFLRRARRKK